MQRDQEIGDSGNRAGRMKAALRQREGAQNVAVFTLDLQGRVDSWNPDAETLCGYRAEEVLGHHLSIFYPPEVDPEYPDEELTRAAEDGVHVDEGWRVREDGSRLWAYVVIAAQRSAEGAVRRFIMVVRDDTAAHLRQERSAQRFSDLLNLAPVGVGLLDEHGRFREVNEALCRLSAYTPEDLVGMRALELVHPRDRAQGLGLSELDGVGGQMRAETNSRVEPGRSKDDDTSPDETAQRTLVRRDGHLVTCEIRSVTSVEDDGQRFLLVVFQDVTDRVQGEQLLQHQATHDMLTGLLNRRGIEPLLRDADALTAVLMCDIDNFRRVNDAFGHAAGDALLVWVARKLSDESPPGCTVARLQGDEFLIIANNIHTAIELRELADGVAGILNTMAPVGQHLVRVSAAVGAALPPRDVVSGEDLLRYAEIAMYTAKRRGTHKVLLSEGAMMNEVAEQVRLEGHLAQALRTDRLELHYQPIVDKTRTLTAAEALVRWRHHEKGLLTAGSILQIAEQAGLMEEFDSWVLRTALQNAASWPAENDGSPVRVSVNLSNHAAGNPEFLAAVPETLRQASMPPERLILEITETSLVELSESTVRAIEDLISIGVTFAVDDFGTGYSSLARLKNLPKPNVKLDLQFAAGVTGQEIDRAIIRSAVDIAHANNRRCVAEGVETMLQFHMLEVLGVDDFQGYLFSRPLPAEEFEVLMKHRGQLPH